MVSKGNTTPDEILKNIEKAKEYYLTMLLSGAIFGYLLAGAAITAATSFIFLKRN